MMQHKNRKKKYDKKKEKMEEKGKKIKTEK